MLLSWNDGKSKRDWRAYIYIYTHDRTFTRILIFRGAERILTVKIAAVAFDIYAFRPNKRNSINTRWHETHRWKQIAKRASARVLLRAYCLPAYGCSIRAFKVITKMIHNREIMIVSFVTPKCYVILRLMIVYNEFLSAKAETIALTDGAISRQR